MHPYRRSQTEQVGGPGQDGGPQAVPTFNADQRLPSSPRHAHLQGLVLVRTGG